MNVKLTKKQFAKRINSQVSVLNDIASRIERVKAVAKKWDGKELRIELGDEIMECFDGYKCTSHSFEKKDYYPSIIVEARGDTDELIATFWIHFGENPFNYERFLRFNLREFEHKIKSETERKFELLENFGKYKRLVDNLARLISAYKSLDGEFRDIVDTDNSRIW